MKTLQEVSSTIPVAYGSSLLEMFNVVNEVFISRRLKKGYVDKKCEYTALLI